MFYIKSLAFLAALMAVMNACNGQLSSPGQCPDVLPQRDLEIISYLGPWYVNQKYPDDYSSPSCIRYVHNFKDENTISMEKVQIDDNGEEEYSEAEATMIEPGVFSVRIPGLPNFDSMKFSVLDTDYGRYAIAYNCFDIDDGTDSTKLEQLWVLTRERDPDQDVIDDALDAIEFQGLSTEELVEVDQENCPDE